MAKIWAPLNGYPVGHGEPILINLDMSSPYRRRISTSMLKSQSMYKKPKKTHTHTLTVTILEAGKGENTTRIEYSLDWMEHKLDLPFNTLHISRTKLTFTPTGKVTCNPHSRLEWIWYLEASNLDMSNAVFRIALQSTRQITAHKIFFIEYSIMIKYKFMPLTWTRTFYFLPWWS